MQFKNFPEFYKYFLPDFQRQNIQILPDQNIHRGKNVLMLPICILLMVIVDYENAY